MEIEQLKADLAKLDQILSECPDVSMICLDVANGYSEFFVGLGRAPAGAK